MSNLIMDALKEGFANLIRAFFSQAVRHGFAIIILSLVACGLLIRSISVENGYEQKIERLDQRIDDNNRQWSAALNAARADFLECDLKRQELAIKLAELTVQFRAAQLRKK